ncbi:glycosyltransferase involved in cell wall biosynthesis [Pontibacter aydingkolensis]|uniref:Glycosyltransferase family 4 protein n=1 Tax=Pontibacter aydingkolensis TaxID=1911536 RepID=A0ABS7CXS5_9BACT|nr:glycosyltransferase family 4 protein [Pontibacter aydingkolensis]MBW7468327.1 glycosyltransferase family 4 protein [Pontibacter aydingkolensis]
MHIAVFNQHHHNPDCPATCRHYTFLEELAKRHQVTLITSNGWRSIRITDKYNWAPKGVKLHECKIPYANKMGILQRFFSFAGYAAYSFWKGLTMPKPDVIWAISTPLSTPWVAAQVASIRNVPWVFEVQDLWPSFPIEMGAVNYKWMEQLLYRTEKNLYNSASHIITLSPDMSAYVAGLDISIKKITTNYNGTDIAQADAISEQEVEELRLKYNLQGKQVVLYAGTYGRANDMLTLMKTIKSMAADASITFILTGNGYYEPQLKALAAQVPNLLLLKPQPRPEVFNLFRLAAISLVTFNDLPVLATNSPSKFYDSLACNTPVIVTNPGWTKRFVEEYGVGWYTPAEQPEALAESIKYALSQPEELKAAGARGKAIAYQLFDRQELVKEVEQVLVGSARV